MKLRISLVLLLTAFTFAARAQSLNAYKYVIVPTKFDFLKEDNQYDTNALARFLFEKEGFITLYNNERKPEELLANPCLALNADVKNNSGLFITKLVVSLVNCKNETVYMSPEGKSKEKEYKKAYHEALRNALNGLSALNYRFSSAQTPKAGPVAEMQKKIVVPPPPAPESSNVEIAEEQATEVVAVVEDKDADISDNKAMEEPEKQALEKETATATSGELLYAQQIPNGYQLVDSTPRIVYILLNTGDQNVFIIKDKNGTLTRAGDKWIANYYEGDVLVKKELQIKF